MDIVSSIEPSSQSAEQQTAKFVNLCQAGFFVVSRKEDCFLTTSEFLLHKIIQHTVSNIKKYKKLKSGDLLLDVSDRYQENTLLKCTTFSEFPVEVMEHVSMMLNSRGDIAKRETLYCTEE